LFSHLYLPREFVLLHCWPVGHCKFMRELAPKLPLNAHLPPHLRKVCAILAVGLLRLRDRSAEHTAADPLTCAGAEESSLHFTADQSVCANRTNRRRA
jgi:hypothetical protein